MKSFFEKYRGQPIAIMCIRYWYRGIVSEVSDTHVILSNAHAVDRTGASTNEKAAREEALPSDWLVTYQSIESAGFPTWCYYGVKSYRKQTKGEKNES